ncbi:hypothetical protein EI546_06605 [Aequorivita sp. H23M31]|uniref:Uncharacterized protein n=1 Tax=Aequorivita ciconiae TaxID=2494375 RepID=A0A410G2E3_9FLAO|nr:hypothetical protein [Aequorivita sp. H23M31]QAA81420.1 hypothetical protein EI546_06605 [Aequorivita sp. H23M31]
MIQKNIRPYGGVTYSIGEGAELVEELDKRTRHADPKLNSIQLLAEAIIGLRNFTTQTITNGGNYNDLEVTADLLVFTNENAQAIINGIKGKKDFHILNLSENYEVRINHDSPSVGAGAFPLKLPTAGGSVGIKGTARILYTESYGYFVADTWGSLYRPEYKHITKEVLMTVDENQRAGSKEMTEYEVFRDAQSVTMSSADLNIAYPNAVRPFNVVCKQLGLIYKKVNDSPSEWASVPMGNDTSVRILELKRNITAAEMKVIGASPITLIPAPGAGKAIELISSALKIDAPSTIPTTFQIVVGYSNSFWSWAWIVGTSTAGIYQKGGYGPGEKIIPNHAVFIQSKGDDPAHEFPGTIYLTYRIITL